MQVPAARTCKGHDTDKTKQKSDPVKDEKKKTAKINVEQMQSRELSGLSTSWNNEKRNNAPFHAGCFEDKHFWYILLNKSARVKKKTKTSYTQRPNCVTLWINTFHAAAFLPCVSNTLRSHACIIAAALLTYSGRIRWSRVWAGSQHSPPKGSNPVGPWLGDGFCSQTFCEIRMCHPMLVGNVNK